MKLFNSSGWSRARLASSYLIGTLASSALVIIGAHRTVPVALLWIGLGIAIGVAVLLVLSPGLNRVAKCEVGLGKSITILMVLSIAYMAAAELLQQEYFAAAAVAIGLPVSLLIDNAVNDGDTDSSTSEVLFVAGVIGITTGWVLLVLGGSAVVRLAGGTTALGGLTLFRLGLPQILDETFGNAADKAEKNVRSRLGCIGGVTGLASALLLLIVRDHRLVITCIFVFALAATLYAEHTLGKEPLRSDSSGKSGAGDNLRRWTWPQVVAHFLVGFGFLVLGWLSASTYLGEWSSAVILIAVLFVLVGAFAILRGELLAGLLLLGFIWGWTVHDTTIGEQELAADGRVIVALGDSFTAGQGANEFFDGNNTIGADDASSCRRSPSAYSSILAESLSDAGGDSWTTLNLACSGAETANLNEVPQKEDQTSGPGSATQLDELRDAAQRHDLKDRLDLVVLTIGGNDVGFAKVAAACMLPSRCSERGFWHDLAYDLRHPESGLQSNLAAVKEAVGEIVPDREVPIVVLLYPRLVGDLDCDLALREDERDFVTELTAILNRSLVEVASTQNLAVFPHSFDAFDDGDGTRTSMLLCDNPRGANFLHLLAHDGPLRERFNPVNWKDGSGHPRHTGHTRFAEVLAPWVAEGLQRMANNEAFYTYNEDDFAALPTGEPDGYAPTELTEGVRLSDEKRGLSKDEDDWVVDQLVDTSQTVAPGLAALIAGGLFWASAGYGFAGHRRLFPDPPSKREKN